MLSDATLERVSVAYRRGYRDGYASNQPFCAVRPEFIKPFAEFDYDEGYKAGANDKKHEKLLEMPTRFDREHPDVEPTEHEMDWLSLSSADEDAQCREERGFEKP